MSSVGEERRHAWRNIIEFFKGDIFLVNDPEAFERQQTEADLHRHLFGVNTQMQDLMDAPTAEVERTLAAVLASLDHLREMAQQIAATWQRPKPGPPQ